MICRKKDTINTLSGIKVFFFKEEGEFIVGGGNTITMINRRQSRITIVAFIGVCIIIIAAASLLIPPQLDLFSDDHISRSPPRRFLLSVTIDDESIYSYAEKGLQPITEPDESIYSYAEKGLQPVTEPPDPKNESVSFLAYTEG